MHLHINVKNIYKFDYLWPDLDFAVYLWKWHAVEQTLPLKFIYVKNAHKTYKGSYNMTYMTWLCFQWLFWTFFALVMTLTRV